MEVSLRLRFEFSWIAEGNGLVIRADTLDELDKEIAKELKKLGYKGTVKVHMKFDYETIPQWIRQFHPHYFNRTVVLKID
ncbi:DUF5395 domain-containing protein [Archaeoglobus profundus]|uniref:Uncharacterized protein n=1 Tax=Archaeoglobus profundus (strain DSM 5631 / JCM 9629 / NBRC 100127 / Av18) TaxID=572546 RepID=D2REY7_ARCPA|nr:DUF5395 domain-containing protein [Archaeoglobus profundus]ADB58681.1 conserved hypothetical protein [Archaeoglobus profundus DSM 5631]